MGRDPQDPDEFTGTLKKCSMFLFFSCLSFLSFSLQAGYLAALACQPANQPTRFARVTKSRLFFPFFFSLGVWHVKPKHPEGSSRLRLMAQAVLTSVPCHSTYI